MPGGGKASILVPAMRSLFRAAAFLSCMGVAVSALASGAAPAAGTAPATAVAPATAAAPAVGAAQGAALSESADFDPTRFIGLDMSAAVSSLGIPQNVFSFRGQEDTQDNVVFFYPDFFYLFWYKDRVWQVRCDRRFAKPLFGVAMGMPREVIERTSPRKLMAKGDSLFFDVVDAKYPLRVRLVFSNDALSDVYVYRSDF